MQFTCCARTLMNVYGLSELEPTSIAKTPGRDVHGREECSMLYIYLRDPEEIEKEEQATAAKAVTNEEFQCERTAPAPKFTATQPISCRVVSD
ncbi:small ribosomal subunit protein uS2-like [Panthera onca]